MIHTRIPCFVIADDRWFLCGGDPPARSVRRNHFSRHNGYSDGKEANSSPSTPRSLTTSARRITAYNKGAQPGCGPTGRTARIGSNRISNSIVKMIPRDDSKLSNSISNQITRDGISFRWPCYQIQADTPVDVWSNHACQVALFFPSVRTAC